MYYCSLVVLDGEFSICRLSNDAPWPTELDEAPWCSVTRTPTELSVVCPRAYAPAAATCHHGWSALRVAGTLDLNLVGVLSSLISPLSQQGLSVFCVSTYDTDYLLVRGEQLEECVRALEAMGHSVDRS